MISVDTLKINNNTATITLNPKIYSLDCIYSASYVLLDKAYIFLKGDPTKEILVDIKPKQKTNPEQIALAFIDELINYADYAQRAQKTKKIRETLLQRALITNDSTLLSKDVQTNDPVCFDKEPIPFEEDTDYLEDPEEIAVPWEEKYGKQSKDSSDKRPI